MLHSLSIATHAALSAPPISGRAEPPSHSSFCPTGNHSRSIREGWWLALTTVVGLFHAKVDERVMRIINRTCGLLVMGCGLAVLIHLALKFA